MQSYFVRFGRRRRLPSTVEILDELRSGYLPGYVHKSRAQHGFARPTICGADTGETAIAQALSSGAGEPKLAPHPAHFRLSQCAKAIGPVSSLKAQIATGHADHLCAAGPALSLHAASVALE